MLNLIHNYKIPDSHFKSSKLLHINHTARIKAIYSPSEILIFN